MENLTQILAILAKYGITAIETDTPEAIAAFKKLALGYANTWLPMAKHQLATLQNEETVAKFGKGKLKDEIGVFAFEIIVAALEEEIKLLSPTVSNETTNTQIS